MEGCPTWASQLKCIIKPFIKSESSTATWAQQYSNTLICARMQSSHLPPLAPWATCYPAAPKCIFQGGRPVPHYVARSVSAETHFIPPVPWGFVLWAQFCEVLAIAFGAAEEETRHLHCPVLVSAGGSVCSGFWWLFFIAIFVSCFLLRSYSLHSTRQNTKQEPNFFYL